MRTTVKRKKAVSTGMERISYSNIRWYLEGKGLKLCDMDIEYIENRLLENCTSGELRVLAPCGNETVWGSWSIEI